MDPVMLGIMFCGRLHGKHRMVKGLKLEGMGAGPGDKGIFPSDKNGLQDGDGLFVLCCESDVRDVCRLCRGPSSPRASPRPGALRRGCGL